MPRVRRPISSTGYYHVMIRGNSRQILFESDDDRTAFLAALDRALDEPGMRLLAWCLMDNHVHLLIDDPNGMLSQAMKRVEVTYAIRYNRKADRVGHVFQDRFRSIPIESDEQLLKTAGYIHNNPVKADICPADEYPWSSYSEYVGHATHCDTSTVLEMLGGVEEFKSFVAACLDEAYDPWSGKRPTGDQLIASALELLGVDDLSSVKGLPIDQRNRALIILRDGGFSIRQAERVTGIGRGTIERVFLSAPK